MGASKVPLKNLFLILCLAIAVIATCFILLTPALTNDADLLSGTITYVREQQFLLHRQLAVAIKSLQDGGALALWSMISISFLYGVFHAAGPGHGKAIIGTYLLTHESQLKKGIALSFASSFVQGLSAILLIGGLVGILGWSRSQARDAVPWLEMLSFGLIGVLGLLLMVRAARSFLKLRSIQTANHSHAPHNHDSNDQNVQNHSHGTEGCDECGHSHAPSPDLLPQGAGWRDTISIVLSIGIRPCSGSILVLIFAGLFNLPWAGVLSVLAISLGTALTVSGLAIVTVYFRQLALRLLNTQSGSLVAHASILVMLLGGSLITLLSLSLLASSYSAPHPLL